MTRKEFFAAIGAAVSGSRAKRMPVLPVGVFAIHGSQIANATISAGAIGCSQVADGMVVRGILANIQRHGICA